MTLSFWFEFFFAIVFVVIPTPIVPAKQGQTVPRRHGMFMGLTRPHWHWSHKCTPAADVRRWTTPPLPPTPCRVRVTGPSSPPPHCPRGAVTLLCDSLWGGDSHGQSYRLGFLVVVCASLVSSQAREGVCSVVPCVLRVPSDFPDVYLTVSQVSFQCR